MARTDGMSIVGYVELVRRVVAWVATQEYYPTYGDIARRYHLNHAEIDDICGDSDAYGPRLMAHEQNGPRSSVTVEVLD